MRNSTLFLSAFLVSLALPVTSFAASQQLGAARLTRAQYHEMSALLPANWNIREADNMESVYRVYTPLSLQDRRGNLTSIHLSRDANTSDYATLEGALKLLRGGETAGRIISSRKIRFADMEGFEIRFREMNCRELYCPARVVDHLWRFGQGESHFYVLGLNGTTKFVEQNKALYERVFRSLRIK